MTVASSLTTKGDTNPEGLRQYYVAKIEKLQLTVTERNQNLRRLQAQRNELNAKVRMLSEELQLLVRNKLFVSVSVRYLYLNDIFKKIFKAAQAQAF